MIEVGMLVRIISDKYESGAKTSNDGKYVGHVGMVLSQDPDSSDYWEVDGVTGEYGGHVYYKSTALRQVNPDAEPCTDEFLQSLKAGNLSEYFLKVPCDS